MSTCLRVSAILSVLCCVLLVSRVSFYGTVSISDVAAPFYYYSFYDSSSSSEVAEKNGDDAVTASEFSPLLPQWTPRECQSGCAEKFAASPALVERLCYDAPEMCVTPTSAAREKVDETTGKTGNGTTPTPLHRLKRPCIWYESGTWETELDAALLRKRASTLAARLAGLSPSQVSRQRAGGCTRSMMSNASFTDALRFKLRRTVSHQPYLHRHRSKEQNSVSSLWPVMDDLLLTHPECDMSKSRRLMDDPMSLLVELRARLLLMHDDHRKRKMSSSSSSKRTRRQEERKNRPTGNANASSSKKNKNKTHTDVPLIWLRGDSTHRNLFSALINIFRRLELPLDRQTHGSMRYLVSTRGDMIQYGPSLLSTVSSRGYAQIPGGSLPQPPPKDRAVAEAFADVHGPLAAPLHASKTTDTTEGGDTADEEQEQSSSDVVFSPPLPDDFGEVLLDIRYASAFRTYKQLSYPLIPTPLLRRAVIVVQGGMGHEPNMRAFHIMNNLAEWDAVSTFSKVRGGSRWQSYLARDPFSLIGDRTALAYERRRRDEYVARVFSATSKSRDDGTSNDVDHKNNGMILGLSWVRPAIRDLGAQLLRDRSEFFVQLREAMILKTTMRQQQQQQQQHSNHLDVGVLAERLVERQLAADLLHFACIIKPVHPRAAEFIDVRRPLRPFFFAKEVQRNIAVGGISDETKQLMMYYYGNISSSAVFSSQHNSRKKRPSSAGLLGADGKLLPMSEYSGLPIDAPQGCRDFVDKAAVQVMIASMLSGGT